MVSFWSSLNHADFFALLIPLIFLICRPRPTSPSNAPTLILSLCFAPDRTRLNARPIPRGSDLLSYPRSELASWRNYWTRRRGNEPGFSRSLECLVSPFPLHSLRQGDL
jgi:hypothetical protein